MSLYNLNYDSGSIEETMAIRALNHQRETELLKTIVLVLTTKGAEAKEINKAIKNFADHMMPEEKLRSERQEKESKDKLMEEIRKGPIKLMPLGNQSIKKRKVKT